MLVNNVISKNNLDLDFVFDVTTSKVRNISTLIGNGSPTISPIPANKIWLWVDATTNSLSHYWNGTSWIVLFTPVSSSRNIRSVATATTIISTDDTIVYTAAVTQPVGVSINKRVLNLKNGSATTVLTLTGHIDGVPATSLLVSAKNSITLHGDGVTWWII